MGPAEVKTDKANLKTKDSKMTLPNIKVAIAIAKSLATKISSELSDEDGSSVHHARSAAHTILDSIHKDLTPELALNLAGEFSHIANLLSGSECPATRDLANRAVLAAFAMDSIHYNVSECDDIVA